MDFLFDQYLEGDQPIPHTDIEGEILHLLAIHNDAFHVPVHIIKMVFIGTYSQQPGKLESKLS